MYYVLYDIWPLFSPGASGRGVEVSTMYIVLHGMAWHGMGERMGEGAGESK